MRGILGPGINRMNIYTVRQATEGLARFMDTQGEETKRRGVAIAYDSRHQSPEFAMEAAKTLAQSQYPILCIRKSTSNTRAFFCSPSFEDVCGNHGNCIPQSSSLQRI